MSEEKNQDLGLARTAKKTSLTKKKKKKKKKKPVVDLEAERKRRQKAAAMHAASRGLGAAFGALADALNYINLDGTMRGEMPEE